jgi:hypothetical protein
MSVVQAYAAYDLARLEKCNTTYALSKRVEAITSINKILEDVSEISDGILLAILGIIAIDVQAAAVATRKQHRAEARLHAAGFAKLLQIRGGVGRLPPWLETFYHWCEGPLALRVTAEHG